MLIIILIQGCHYSESENNNLLSYEQFKKLFNELSEEFLPTNFVKVASTDNVELVAIDKESSFGKREILTLTGEQSNQETQERVVYGNEENKQIIYIDIIYLTKELDKDMVYWNSGALNEQLDNDIIKNFDENILSFYNILIKVTVFTEGIGKDSNTILRETTLELVNYLNKND